MDPSIFSSHHRPLLPPPFFLTASRGHPGTPPSLHPLPHILYRPAPATKSLKFSPLHSHSIARLAGIQAEKEERAREEEDGGSEERVESSESDEPMVSFSCCVGAVSADFQMKNTNTRSLLLVFKHKASATRFAMCNLFGFVD